MALKKKRTDVEATPTTTDVTTAADTSVAVHNSASVFITNPMFVEAVQDAEFGMFQSIVASNGTHMAGNEDLGKVLEFQAIVANTIYKMTPGSADEEAREYFAVASTKEELEDAKQEAQNAGYDKAEIKKYIDIICLITDCEKEEYIGETMTLQVAPSSQFTWNPLAGKLKMRSAMGKLKTKPIAGNPELGSAVVFRSTATPTSWKGNNFTKFVFEIA